MPNWRHILIQLATAAENHLPTLKRALDQRWGDAPTRIVTYHGYGTSDCLFLKGRVLEDLGIRSAGATDSAWRNLSNMYRRFDSDAIPGARLLARFGAVEQTVVADDEGFFEARLLPDAPLPHDCLWHTVELTLLAPQPARQAQIRATGRVLVPPPSSQFGVISDIDDTVIRTNATSYGAHVPCDLSGECPHAAAVSRRGRTVPCAPARRRRCDPQPAVLCVEQSVEHV